MNCCNCQKRIRTPKPDYSVAELIELCRPRCLSCNPNEIPRGGSSQEQLTDFTASKRLPVPIVYADADDCCVGVSPDAFARLREAMTALFALSPIDLLIVQHIANGGKLDAFPKVYIDLMAKCKLYHGSPRQMVKARKDNIIKKIPQLGPLIKCAMTRTGLDKRTVG